MTAATQRPAGRIGELLPKLQDNIHGFWHLGLVGRAERSIEVVIHASHVLAVDPRPPAEEWLDVDGPSKKL